LGLLQLLSATILLTKQKLATELGKRIKEIRLSKGFSLKYFESFDHSIDRHRMSKIENGKTIPSIYTLLKIGNLLDVELKDFFKKIRVKDDPA
jgi:transcriptional regulator with XRE-family HTH domain